MSTKKPTKIKGIGKFWYILASIIGVAGLVFVIFGIVGDYLPVLNSENWIKTSEDAWLQPWIHMGYRYFGIILVLLAAFIAMLSLTIFAREGDRDAERNLRRAQRLAIEQEPTVKTEVVEETK